MIEYFRGKHDTRQHIQPICFHAEKVVLLNENGKNNPHQISTAPVHDNRFTVGKVGAIYAFLNDFAQIYRGLDNEVA